jgi:hypothetical protein
MGGVRCMKTDGLNRPKHENGDHMLNTQGLNIAEGQGMRLVSAGDVMGWLGGLPLALIEDVRMGRTTTGAKTAQAFGSVGAMDCASGTGECGVGADCAGGSGCCGFGGDCAGH